MICKVVTVIVGLIAVLMGLIATGVLHKTDIVANLVAKNKPELIGMVPLTTKQSDLKNCFKVESLPSLTGKVALVTGGNSGIGYETVKSLASKGAEVIMACRSQAKCTEAASMIKGKVSTMLVDMSSMKSVGEFSKEFLKRYKRLDIFVQNAGIGVFDDHTITPEGVELIFATNFLGHFKMHLAFEKLLETTAKLTGDVRIVLVSSAASFDAIPEVGVHLNLKDLNDKSKSSGVKAYGQSKLAQGKL